MISPLLATWHPTSWTIATTALAVPVSVGGAVLLRAVWRLVRRRRMGTSSNPDLSLEARDWRRQQLALAEDVESRWR